MAHKFKPGDAVFFRQDLVVGETYGHIVWTDYMDATFDKGVEYILLGHYGDDNFYSEEDCFINNKYELSLYVSDEMLESKQ